MRYDKCLVWLLRFDAVALSLAFVAVFLPGSFMESSHEAMGMGEFPAVPLVDYLTRSVAVMYATRGLFVWLASTDVKKYGALIRLVGASNVLIGAFLLFIDLHAGMPMFWVMAEGPSIAMVGLLVLWLEGRARRSASDAT